ncbi:class I SAM-dependent methyltransferase [Methanofollis sp. UBA420]|jgi:SAM-dependent methyltransferase|uniref:class I SAM-dependent methyltransferase n=1 Tax=Methanofollis sp. UBA420 TaxID=1915514 RepID=UPI00316AE995
MKPRISIDWNEVWTDQYEQSSRCNGSEECATIWASKERAREFLEQTRQNPERTGQILAGLPLTPETRLLDVGAGPGTLAIPLAATVAHVTAVEPAAGMVAVMEEMIADEGITNISVVPRRWEEVDPQTDLDLPYDIVLASYSLGMPDLRAAIETMCRASSRWVYLFWFAGTASWERPLIDLWPSFHGTEYRCWPKADVLFNLLYSMGIYPNVECRPMEHIRRFPSLDVAVAEYRQQFDIQNPDDERLLRAYLLRHLAVENGEFVQREKNIRVKIWWEV